MEETNVADEPCPPTTRSREALAATLQREMHDAGVYPVTDDTELHELRARVERLKLENFALMRDEKAMRETKNECIARASELLEALREGRRLLREYEAACLDCATGGSQDAANGAYHALVKWVSKDP